MAAGDPISSYTGALLTKDGEGKFSLADNVDRAMILVQLR